MIEQIKQAQSWEERYRLIIQAGKKLPQPSAEELAQMQPIAGCEASLWFGVFPAPNGTFQFRGYSEARIMNGLLWLLLQPINGQNAAFLQQFSVTDFFAQLGISARLSESRLNGLKQIAEQIQQCI